MGRKDSSHPERIGRRYDGDGAGSTRSPLRFFASFSVGDLWRKPDRPAKKFCPFTAVKILSDSLLRGTMLATFSNEGRINDKLQELGCPLIHFSLIAAKGVVGRTRLTEAMKGGRPLEQGVAEKLLAVLDQMAALKNDLPISPDWSEANRIHALLQARGEARKLFEEVNI